MHIYYIIHSSIKKTNEPHKSPFYNTEDLDFLLLLNMNGASIQCHKSGYIASRDMITLISLCSEQCHCHGEMNTKISFFEIKYSNV